MTGAILTIITLISLMAAIVMFCALTIHKGVTSNLYAENTRLSMSVAELIYQRNDGERMVATQRKQIDGHLRDNSILLFDLEQLKRGRAELDAGGLIAEVEEWLAEGLETP